MCGRVGFFSDAQFIKDVSNIIKEIDQQLNFKPSYNIAPSQNLPALLNDGFYRATLFGLIPHWAKDRKLQPINARSETISDKPMFRESFQRRRCLIPVNGFYEWQKIGKGKVPHWIHPLESDYFALAGIYDTWQDRVSGEIITSSAIITTTLNAVMAPIHDRMPVILEPQVWSLWLDRDVGELEALKPLLVPYDEKKMEAYAVSTLVNSPANDSQACIHPIDAYETISHQKEQGRLLF